MFSCPFAGLCMAMAVIVGVAIVTLMYVPINRWFPPLFVVVVFSIQLLILCIVPAVVGGGYGVAALILRSFVADGRNYLSKQAAKKAAKSNTLTPEHTDPAPADRQ